MEEMERHAIKVKEMSVKENTPWESSQISLEKRFTQLEEVIVGKLETIANQKPNYAKVTAKQSGDEKTTVNLGTTVVAKLNEELEEERERKEKFCNIINGPRKTFLEDLCDQSCPSVRPSVRP